MKRIGMLSDLARSAFRRPVTERYPFEKRPTPPQFRGLLRWDPESCTGCALCAKDCPTEALELITIDKADKRFVIRYHVDRCTFCGQCAYGCRQACIDLTEGEYELAQSDRGRLIVVLGRPEDIERLEQLENGAAPVAAPA